MLNCEVDLFFFLLPLKYIMPRPHHPSRTLTGVMWGTFVFTFILKDVSIFLGSQSYPLLSKP